MTRETRFVGPLETRPVTAERWGDLARLFSSRGLASSCWCMWFRRPRREWRREGADGNRRAMETIVRGNERRGCWPILMGGPWAGARSRRGRVTAAWSAHQR